MWRRPDNRRDSGDAYTAKVRNLGTQVFSLAVTYGMASVGLCQHVLYPENIRILLNQVLL